METMTVYVVHDADRMVAEPMAFPTLENAVAYARAECGENTIVIPVPVVRYAGSIHPVDVLMRPTGGTAPEGQVQEIDTISDGKVDDAVSSEGDILADI